MVVHFATVAENQDAPLVGFVVSKAVGNAVTRNLVKRRLRSIVRAHLAQFPVGSMIVVRALPKAAQADYAKLGSDFTACIDKVMPFSEQGAKKP